MSKINKIDRYLNSTYHQNVALLPRKMKDAETDDFVAWKLGRKVIKASMKICRKKHVAAMTEHQFFPEITVLNCNASRK